MIAAMSPEEKAALLGELKTEVKTVKQQQKEAYESLRDGFLKQVRKRFTGYLKHGNNFKSWLRKESEGFFEVLKDYGQLKRGDQLGFTLADDDFRFIVKGSKVKGFDERSNVAEKRLTEFLREWVETQEGGERNPMYKLAMTMIQRNEAGDLDYKSISRLYELEDDFADPEYSEIMQLFKESNTVEGTAIYFLFEERDHNGKFRRVEPSFNRL